MASSTPRHKHRFYIINEAYVINIKTVVNTYLLKSEESCKVI